jgi:hypothetical protein
MEYGSTEQILYRGWRGVGGTMVPDAGVGSGPLVNGDDLIWAVRIKTKKMQFTIGTQLGVFQRVLSFNPLLLLIAAITLDGYQSI